MLKAYRNTIAELAQMGTLDVWYTKIDEQMLLTAIHQRGKEQGKGKDKALKSATKPRRPASTRFGG